jgi:hypothetical protein
MTWILWALVGWCGTPWPHRWFPHPPTPPDPDPVWMKIAGVIGGIAGGFVFDRVWPMGGNVTSVEVAVTAIGAFIGAIVLSDITSMARVGRSA